MMGQLRVDDGLPQKSIFYPARRQAFRGAAALVTGARSLAMALLSAEYAAKMAAARHEGGHGLAARLAAIEAERKAKEVSIKLRTAAAHMLRRTSRVSVVPPRPMRRQARWAGAISRIG